MKRSSFAVRFVAACVMILVSLLPAAAFAAPPAPGGSVTQLFKCTDQGARLPFPISYDEDTSGARIGWIYKEPNPPTGDTTNNNPGNGISYLDPGGNEKPHQGIDILMSDGSPVYALGRGTVAKHADDHHLTIWYPDVTYTDVDTGSVHNGVAVFYGIVKNIGTYDQNDHWAGSLGGSVTYGEQVAQSSTDSSNGSEHLHMSFAAAKTLDEAIAYNDLTPNQSIDPSQILGADVGWARRYAEDPVTPLNWGNSTIHARPGSQWSMDDWCGGPYFDKSTAFAVSDTANLFAINQDTNQWVWIAQLRINNSGQGYPSLNNGVGDIATAPDGTLYLSDYLDLYRLDQNTGLATLIGQFGTNQRINGLAFGPTGELFGSSGDGALYQIDKTTGTATRIGGYGEGYISPGDLVVDGTGQIYATVYDETSSSNYIARINPKNGHATLIGKGFADQIPGLYFFGQQLYGVSVVSSHCSGTGALLTIGTNTGEAKFQSCLTTFDGQRSFNAFGASSVPQATHAQQVKNAYQEHECLEAQQRKHKPSLVEKLYHSLGLIAYSC